MIDLNQDQAPGTGSVKDEASRPSSEKKTEVELKEENKDFAVGSDFNSSATVAIDLSRGQNSETGSEKELKFREERSSRISEKRTEQSFAVGSNFNSSATVVIDLNRKGSDASS